jgi:hypothetical protein
MPITPFLNGENFDSGKRAKAHRWEMRNCGPGTQPSTHRPRRRSEMWLTETSGPRRSSVRIGYASQVRTGLRNPRPGGRTDVRTGSAPWGPLQLEKLDFQLD